MKEIVMPRLNKTGEFAQIELTTRTSRHGKGQINVRMSLPRRSMFVSARGSVEMLPRSPEATGLPLVQFPISVN